MATESNNWVSFGKTVGLVALTAVVIILLIQGCELRQSLSEERALSTLNDSLLQEEVERTKDELGRELVEYKTKLISTEQLLTSKSNEAANLHRRLEEANLKVKNLMLSLEVALETRDTMYIPVGDTIYLTEEDSAQESDFEWSDDWLTLDGNAEFTTRSNGFTFEGVNLSYNIKNKLSTDWVWERKLFKKDELHLLVENQNPNTTTDKVQTYVIKVETPWYKKWWVNLLVGFAGGFGTGIAATQ